MDFARQPLLTLEAEKQLADKMLSDWNKGRKGLTIAKELQFGVPGTPYEKLKPNYIYFYKHKFNTDKELHPEFVGKFKLRRKPSFRKGDKNYRKNRYRNKPKKLGLMEPEVFKKKLNKKLPKSDDLSVKSKRAFLIAIYWTGLRSSELYERVFDDFEITETKLIIHLLRKKKKVHEDDEPISIRRDFPLVEEVVEWLQSQEWRTKVPARDKYNRIIRVNERRHFVVNDRPWNICRQTAQNYVDEVFAGYYPHYFRYNFVTSTTKVPSMKVSELRAKTHLSLAALENYVFTPEGEEDELDRRKAEQMKAKGVM